MVLEFVVNDDGRTGVDLRRHRGPHNLLGKGQCRRLAKLVPSACSDNGTAAELTFGFVEWLSSPILFLDDTVQDMFVYQFLIGLERMGNALDSALAKIKDDACPRECQVRGSAACSTSQRGHDSSGRKWAQRRHLHRTR